MGDQQRGAPGPAESSERVGTHLGTQVLVEARERLVEEHDRGPRRQSAREGHPLLLTARELVGEPPLEPGQADHPQQLGDACCPLGARGSSEPERHVAGDIEVREERVVLEHHPHPAPLGGPVPAAVVDHLAVDLHDPRVGVLQPGHQPQQGRLAAPGRSDDGDHLAGAHLEVERAHGVHRAVALVDATQRECGHRTTPPDRSTSAAPGGRRPVVSSATGTTASATMSRAGSAARVQ